MPPTVKVLGCPMGSQCLFLLGGHQEVNGAMVSPYCWHRVSQGWWMLSLSPLPLWQQAGG